ncbi:MAG: hypothetical protein R3350_00820 [Saprospiraceae bacterium]|nr:hypothetical protein [Saprospiraceae bacterium]
MYRTILFLLGLLCCSPLEAQQSLALGQWRSHLPYRIGQYVTQGDEYVFYATDWSVMALHKEERSPRFISKVDGLSGVGIRLIKYNSFSDILLVVYEDSAIDLVSFEQGVPHDYSSMNQIRNFDNFVGEKFIYDLHIDNDSIVYVAANYGISKIDIRQREFVFTTFTGIDVLGVQLHRGFIYAATEEGIYRVSEDALIPEDFGKWEWLGPELGLPPDYSARQLVVFDDDLFAGINDSIFRLNLPGREFLHVENGFRLQYLGAEGNHLLAGYRCNSGACDRGRGLLFDASGTMTRLTQGCFGVPNYGIEDAQGRLWFGDGWRDFRLLEKPDQNFCTTLSFNSPYSRNNREMKVHEDELWVAAGGVNQTFSNRFLDHGFFSFIDGQWTTYNRHTRDELLGVDGTFGSDDLLDFITIAVHPETGTVYAGSFFEGLIVFDGDDMQLYNDQNSSLGNAIGDFQRTRVSGLDFDEENRLWIANHLADRPVSVLTPEGEWKSFRPACNITEIHQVVVDQNGYKWFVVNSSQAAAIVFDEGELDNPADDRCRVFNATNSNIPTNNSNALAVDLEGDVWLGTTEGVIIFECGANVFDANCRGSRRIVEQDGFGAFLLETEEVTTIAVDGADRKWVGTKNGVFVLSPDGENQVAHFTERNSPLFDDVIIDIAINQQNGEVFIGTEKGILSVQGEAVEGERTHREDLLVFPNPVRPDYDGPIAIRGLARDATVKITDINGKLVFETTSLGGQAIWDGRDFDGRRASSGVYLVFSSSNPRLTGFANPDAAVARILFLR